MEMVLTFAGWVKLGVGLLGPFSLVYARSVEEISSETEWKDVYTLGSLKK